MRPNGVRRTRPRKGGDDSGFTGVAGRRRRDELAAGGVLAEDWSLLRARAQRFQPALPERPRSARVDGPRREDGRAGRRGAELPDRHRLPDRQGQLAAPASRASPAPAEQVACSPPPAISCSRVTPAATSSRSMRPTVLRSGTRGSATSPMRPQTYSIDGRQHVLVSRRRYGLRVRASTSGRHAYRNGPCRRWLRRPASHRRSASPWICRRRGARRIERRQQLVRPPRSTGRREELRPLRGAARRS